MKILILLLLISCSESPKKPLELSKLQLELIDTMTLEGRAYMDGCLKTSGVGWFNYCLKEYKTINNKPYEDKSKSVSTGDIATGVGLGIVGGHLVKKILK